MPGDRKVHSETVFKSEIALGGTGQTGNDSANQKMNIWGDVPGTPGETGASGDRVSIMRSGNPGVKLSFHSKPGNGICRQADLESVSVKSGLALIEIYLKTAVVIPIDWVLIGLIICTIVGIVFGVYPAYKAAKLNPIDALRYE